MSPGKHLGSSDFARVEQLVEECMPELLDFFENRSLSHGQIDRIFFDALYRLAQQWETIQDHQAWLLETLERLARQEAGGPASSEGTAPGDSEDPNPRSGDGDDS